MKKLILLFITIAVVSCKQYPTPATIVITENKPVKQAKNIILMVGDGMGLTQISAGMYSNGNTLNLEKFPAVGLHKSYSADNLVTDSAAGATAFSCGIKTYNGAIGVNTDTLPVQTILEEAELKGLATGLVATSSIVHATPASFVAHSRYRKLHEDIAADFLKTEVDYWVGGGKAFFSNRENDERDLYKELRAKGYTVSDYFEQDFEEVNTNVKGNFAFFTANKEPLPKAQGRDYLVKAASEGVRFLDKHDEEDKGFFMMIEGSQIDWGGHANKTDYIISELLEFNEAIGKVLAFAKQDGETLVVVTADHETGGFAINPGSTMDTIVGAFTSDYHTATMIPVFAYGPGSELFNGIYENTAIYHKMRSAYGWTGLE